jgi:hypothetical protein
MVGLIARLLAAREAFVIIRSILRWVWPRVRGRNRPKVRGRRRYLRGPAEPPKTDMSAEGPDGQVYGG